MHSSSSFGRFRHSSNHKDSESSTNSTSKKMVIVSLDTSDTIDLNRLEVIPMQLMGRLDPTMENVNVKIKSNVDANPNCNVNQNLVDNNEDHDRDHDRNHNGSRAKVRYCYDSSTDVETTITHNKNNSDPYRLSAKQLPSNRNPMYQNQNQQNLKNFEYKKNTNGFKTYLLSPNCKCNSDHNHSKNNSQYHHHQIYYPVSVRGSPITADISPSFDRHSRMIRITTNYTEDSENSECYNQVKMSKRIKQLRKRKTVKLSDILSADPDPIQSQSQRSLREISSPTSEDSWSGVSETVRENIVKRIMDLGLGIQAGTKSSEALQKLQVALWELQNDFPSEFQSPTEHSRSSHSSKNGEEYKHSNPLNTRQSQKRTNAVSLQTLVKGTGLESNTEMANEQQRLQTKAVEYETEEEDGFPKYKPPESMSQLKKSQHVLTWCPNKSDLFTCHSSDCSVTLSGTRNPKLQQNQGQSQNRPTAAPATQIQEHVPLSVQIKVGRNNNNDKNNSTMQRHEHEENTIEPKLSPEKVAAIWNWVSPKYDQINQLNFNHIGTDHNLKATNINIQKNAKSTNTNKTAIFKVAETHSPSRVSRKLRCTRKKLMSQDQGHSSGHHQRRNTSTSAAPKKVKGKPAKNHNYNSNLKFTFSKLLTTGSQEISSKSSPQLRLAISKSRLKQFHGLGYPTARSVSLELQHQHRKHFYADQEQEREDEVLYDSNCLYPHHARNADLSHYPLTQKAFPRVNQHDGSASDIDDIIPSSLRPAGVRPDNIDTGHLHSCVSRVGSSVKCNTSDDDQERRKLIEEFEVHEVEEEKEDNDDMIEHDTEADLDIDATDIADLADVDNEVKLTPPSTSTWNLSPLYASDRNGNGVKSEIENDSNLSSSSVVNSQQQQLTLTSANNPEPDSLNTYNDEVKVKMKVQPEDGKADHKMEVEPDAVRTRTGHPTRKMSSECCSCSCSMSPLICSSDPVAIMTDVHSGDEVATRCSTTSTVTDVEHHILNKDCISNSDSKAAVRICKLSNIRNKLRLFDLLNETNKSTKEKMQLKRNAQTSHCSLHLRTLDPNTPTPSTVTNSRGQELHLEHLNYTEINTIDIYQHQFPRQRTHHPLQNAVPSTGIVRVQLAPTKSQDSMKAQPSLSPTRMTVTDKSPSATNVAGTNQNQNRKHCTYDPAGVTTPTEDNLFRVSLIRKQSSKYRLCDTGRGSSDSLSKKHKRKKTRRRKEKDDDRIDDMQTDEAQVVKEKRHRRHHRRRHKEDNASGNDKNDDSIQKVNPDLQEIHGSNAQCVTKLSKKDKDKEYTKCNSNIEKLKALLPRTPSGRYALSSKLAEEAIAEYVKAELKASLGIRFQKSQKTAIPTGGSNHNPSRSRSRSQNQNQYKAESIRGFIRSVASNLVANRDSSNGSKKGTEAAPSSVAGSKSLKVLGQQRNPNTITNHSCSPTLTRRCNVMDLCSTKKRMSIGIIPKHSTRPNFLRYQQQSLVAMLNCSRIKSKVAHCSRHVSLPSNRQQAQISTGNKSRVELRDSKPGTGTANRCNGTKHNFITAARGNSQHQHQSQSQYQGQGQGSPVLGPDLPLTRSKISPTSRDYDSKFSSPSNGKTKSNRNAVTVVFGSNIN